MQNNTEITETNYYEDNEKIEKKHYLDDKKFLLIKQYQQKIFEATELSPSIRKIINELITEENLKKVTTKFIEIWKY